MDGLRACSLESDGAEARRWRQMLGVGCGGGAFVWGDVVGVKEVFAERLKGCESSRGGSCQGLREG